MVAKFLDDNNRAKQRAKIKLWERQKKKNSIGLHEQNDNFARDNTLFLYIS